MQYVYSTLASDQDIAVWKDGPGGQKQVIKYIQIKGGAQIATKLAGEIITPLGIKTEVTDEDFALLQQDWTFNHFVENGKLVVLGESINPEKVVSDMTLPTVDQGAQMNETELLDAVSIPEGVELAIHDGEKVSKVKAK
jgi:hypothetical protein